MGNKIRIASLAILAATSGMAIGQTAGKKNTAVFALPTAGAAKPVSEHGAATTAASPRPAAHASGVGAPGAAELAAAAQTRAYFTKLGINPANVTESVYASKYQEIAATMGFNGRVGTPGASYVSPITGQVITDADIKSFLATNPSQVQIMARAAALGLSPNTVDNMLTSQGISNVDPGYGTRLNHMNVDLWQGVNGYTTNDQGVIVQGGGHVWINDSNGSGHWELRN